MGAVFLGLGICVAVTVIWGIFMVIEEQCEALRREADKRATRKAVQFQPALDFFNSVHRVECAWCNEVMQGGVEPVSHGICRCCSKEHFNVELPESVTEGKAVRS